MLKFLSRPHEDSEEGFTLIELLVVILIIGILAAIAIPAFLNQRKNAVDASVLEDITQAGQSLTIDAMDGKKKISEPFTITEDGVFSESGAVSPLDFSEIKVSEGTALIVQPSSVDGAVCLFGVNAGGDKAAKSPGYAYDSNAGGLLTDFRTPSACGDETASLIVPEAAIEKALAGETDTPEGSAPPEEDQVVIGDLYHAGKMYDAHNSCYVPGSEYELYGTVDNGFLSWNISGLDHYTFGGNADQDWDTGIIAFGQENGYGGSIEAEFKNKKWGSLKGFESTPFFRSTDSYVPITEISGDYLYFDNPDGTSDFANECGGDAAQTLASHTGTLYDQYRECFIEGADYTFKATAENNIVSWSISGLDKYGFQDGTIKIGSKFGNIDFDNSGEIRNFTYSGSEKFVPNSTYAYFDRFGADPMYFGGDDSKGYC